MSGKRTQKLNLLKHTFDIVISVPQEDVVASVIGCRSTFLFFFKCGLCFFKLLCSLASLGDQSLLFSPNWSHVCIFTLAVYERK